MQSRARRSPGPADDGAPDPRFALQGEFATDDLLCSSHSTLGHGIEQLIRDVIYVKPQTWNPSYNQAIANEIGVLNKVLKGEGRPFLLVGPGRWGSADEWLGIPVQWSQISNVRAMVEASPASYQVEPSQGTHFFQNITSLRIGYFTVPPGSPHATKATRLHRYRLARRPTGGQARPSTCARSA